MPTDRELFEAALDMADPDDRAAYLGANAANPEQLARVRRLLAAHEAAHGFLELPTADIDHTRFALDRTSNYTAGALNDTEIAPNAAHPGVLIAGKYKLFQQIGQGGMGTVWMAEQTDPVKRAVAVKLIRAERGSSIDILARFEAERQAIALMDHPHIARLIDAGTTSVGSPTSRQADSPAEGQPYFVMELVKGVPVTEYCDKYKLSVTDRLVLFQQICAAVQHAHQKGIIHRDLKPSNILVESRDGKPVPKVIDFGLAKAVSGMPLTEHTLYSGFGAVLGTPPYMAPEQASFNAVDIDTRADVYALGVILYELLTGSTPLTRDTVRKATLEEMLQLIREHDAPTPSARLSSSEGQAIIATNRQTEPDKLCRSLKGELDWIVMKALAKERDRRYETASALARDVNRFLNHEPVQAGPPSRRYRLRKFVRRNRPQVVAAALVLFALLAGMAGTTWQAVRAERARAAEADRAEGERVAKEDADAKRLEANAQKANAEAAAAAEKAAKDRAERAAENERTANDAAQKRLLQIQKSNAILLAIFKDVDYQQIKDGADPLEAVLAKRLVEAAAELEGERVGDALVVAELQARLGHTLSSLGYPNEAIPILERARATRTAAGGAAHPDTFATTNFLAMAYRRAGRFDAALPLFEENVRIAKSKFGPGDTNTLLVMCQLAEGYRLAGKLDRAEPLLTEVLKLHDAINLETTPAPLLVAMSVIALAYTDAGRADLAVELLERTLNAQRTRLGADHPHTLTTMHDLARGYLAAQRPDSAAALMEETLKLRTAKQGLDHPDTLTARGLLATACQKAGKPDLAVALDEETLGRMRGRLGIDHPKTLAVMHNLARGYQTTGRLDRAIPLFEETLKRMTAKLGPDHPDTLTTMNHLALIYKEDGKLDRAIPMFEEALKRQMAAIGTDHPETLDTMHNLATAYRLAGRFDRAVPLAEETVKRRTAKLGADHPDTLTSAHELAMAYGTSGKIDRAIRLFEETLERQTTKLGADHTDTLTTLGNLAGAYLRARQFDRALPLAEETVKRRTAKFGADHLSTLLSMHDLGGAYFETGKVDRAASLWEETVKGLTAKLGADHPDTLKTMSALAGAYLSLKRLDLAFPLFEEHLKLVKARYGADHPQTLERLSTLAVAYWKAQRLDRSVPLFEEALNGIEARYGRAHPRTLKAVANLGVNYRDAGRLAEALPLLEEAYRASKREPTLGWVAPQLLTGYVRARKAGEAATLITEMLTETRKNVPKDSPQLAGELAAFGLALLELKAHKEAEPLLRESLTIREKGQPDVWSTFNVQSLLGGALLGQKKYADAEPVLLKGYTGMKAREKTIPPQAGTRIPEALDRLIELYTALGKPDEVTKWRAERVKYPPELAPPPREKK